MTKDEVIYQLEKELKLRKECFPFKDFKPNIGQQRALACWENVDARTGHYPTFNVVTGGNGSGKSTIITADILPAISYGIGALHPSRQSCGFYHHLLDIKKNRQNNQLHVYIVAPPNALKKSGAFVTRTLEWMPRAVFSEMDTFYHHLEINGQHFKLLSSEQDVKQFSGDDCDLIIIDEPVSNQIWSECVGRLRKSGFIFHSVTPLRGCDYLVDIVDNKYASWTKISLWDNCADIEGTNGVLAKHAIDAMIEEWKNHPEELNARVFGDMIKLSGNVFTDFDADIHVVDALPPDEYVYGYAIDPHLVKEPAAIFFAQNNMNQIYVYDEYPRRQWNLIHHTNKTLDAICFELRQYGKGKKFAYTIGDPNMSRTTTLQEQKTIAMEYIERGIELDTNVNDKHYIGTGEINKLLQYNTNYELSSTNCPHLYFTKNCTNMITAMKKYRYKDSANTDKNKSTEEIVETEYKCFVDCLRYAACSIKDYYHAVSIADMKWRRANAKANPIKSTSLTAGTARLW